MLQQKKAAVAVGEHVDVRNETPSSSLFKIMIQLRAIQTTVCRVPAGWRGEDGGWGMETPDELG